MNLQTCERGGVRVLGVDKHADVGDPHTEDGVVHVQLPSGHGSDQVGAVFPARTEQNLKKTLIALPQQ